MKSPKYILWVISMIIMMLAASCSQSAPDQILTPETPSQPTNTTTPTLTTELTPIPTHTPTRLPTDTPAPIPTLPVEQAQAKLLELLSNNGNCRLPCLWGITPGKSDYREARANLIPLGNISGLMSGFTSDGGAMFPVYTENNLKLSLSVGLNVERLVDEQIVRNISFDAREFQVGEPGNPYALKPIYDSKTFGERLRPYMLHALLAEYGIPAAVLISTDGGYERGRYVPGFDIVLFYPDQGIMAAYTTYRQLVNGKVRGCPANAHVEMQLTPAGQPDSFAKIIAQTQWSNLWPISGDNPYWKSVDEATSMTLEQFYETFRQSTDKCIETPANLWPTPEP